MSGDTNHCLRVLRLAERDASLVSWSPAGTRLAFGDSAGTLGVLTVEGQIVWRAAVLPDWVRWVAWSPDGTRIASASREWTVRVWDAVSGREVDRIDEPPGAEHGNRLHGVCWSPDGRFFAWGRWANPSQVRLAAADGSTAPRTLAEFPNPIADMTWAPDSRRLALRDSTGLLRVLDSVTGACLVSFAGQRFQGEVFWSPDGRRLAAVGSDGPEVWDAGAGRLLHACAGPSTGAESVCWSPDGRLLASGGAAGDGSVRLWSAEDGREVLRLDGHDGYIYSMRFAPHGGMLASASADGTVRLWDVSAVSGPPTPKGREEDAAWSYCCRQARTVGRHPRPRPRDDWVPVLPGADAHDLCWDPSGSFLVTGDAPGVVRLWDMRPLQGNVAPPVTVSDSAIRADLARLYQEGWSGLSPRMPPAQASALPTALARLVRVGLCPPLGLLWDLLAVTGGQTASSFSALAADTEVSALSRLHWPEEARVGLAALLLGRATLSDSWRPPPGLSPAELREGLTRALVEADDGPADPYPVPLESIRQALAQVDDRLLMLLRQAGPRAVAADPALPLRLMVKARLLPPASARPELAAAVLRLAAGSGPRSEGSGVERSGLARRGPWRSLLPWQLALPGVALAARQRRGELLFRVGQEAAAVAAGPLVLILDVSPACYGPVEAVTRACAWVAASAWITQGEAVWLVTGGGEVQARPLRGIAELTEVWLLRSSQRVQAARALTAAARLRAALAAGGEEGRVLLLSHVWFGWDEEAPACPGLRGLFARPGGRRGTPAWASACERWAAVPAGDAEAALAALQEILR